MVGDNCTRLLTRAWVVGSTHFVSVGSCLLRIPFIKLVIEIPTEPEDAIAYAFLEPWSPFARSPSLKSSTALGGDLHTAQVCPAKS
jgi:hypothetical protein